MVAADAFTSRQLERRLRDQFVESPDLSVVKIFVRISNIGISFGSAAFGLGTKVAESGCGFVVQLVVIQIANQ